MTKSKELTNPEVYERSIMDILADAVKDPEFDAVKLEKLIGLKERVDATEAKNAFTDAMFSFHLNPPIIIKNKPVYGKDRKKGPQYHFPDLADVLKLVRPELLKVGIVANWSSKPLDDGRVQVTCILRHKMGHELEATLAGPPETGGSKNAIQGVGSADSYLRRYTFLNVTGLVAEGEDNDNDNDGNKPDDEPEPEYITKAEAANIEVQMTKVGVTVAEFLKAAKLTNLSEITASDYDRAMSFIKKRGEHHAAHS